MRLGLGLGVPRLFDESGSISVAISSIAVAATGAETISGTATAALSPLTAAATGMIYEPTAISGLVAWYDARTLSTLFQDSAGTTPVASNNDPVGKWSDKMGNGNHIIQATAGKRPLYKTSQFGSFPAVHGDGVNDVLTAATTTLAGSTGITIAAVIYAESKTAIGLVAAYDRSFNLMGWFNTTGFPIIINDAGSSAGTADITGAAHRMVGTIGATATPTVTLYIDDVAQTPGTGDLTIDNGKDLSLFAMSDSTFPGTLRIGELVVYNRPLTGVEVGQLDTYFVNGWGL